MPETLSPPAPATNPFATLETLSAAHSDLLRRRRFHDDAPESEKERYWDEVRAFVERSQATGVLLETYDERYSVQAILNYWSSALCQTGAEMPDAILAEFDDSQAPELPESLCPYCSLDVGRSDGTGLFLGWDRLIKECVAKLQQTGIVAVVGAAGSGRSSLVRGGLLPALQKGVDFGSAHWRYHVMPVPGNEPLLRLAQLVQPADGAANGWLNQQAESFRKDAGHLARLLGANNETPAVLVIDQFESVLQAGDNQDRQAFLDNLLAAVKRRGTRYWVILVLRSDCLNQAAQLEGMPNLLQQSQVFVAFTTRELRQAIEEPAKHVGLRFDEGVVDRLLRDIQGDPSAMTLLQFTLLNFWDHRQRNRITDEMYRRLGAGRLALERVAETLYQGLDQDEQETLKRMLLQLVQPASGQEFNITAVRRAQLYSADSDRARVDRIFDQLVRARLVRVSAAEKPQDALVNVWHEALISHWPRLVEWLSDERDSKRRRLRLTSAAEQWRDKRRDEGALWGGTLLEEAKHYTDRTANEDEFVRASAEFQARETRREQRIRYGTYGAIAVIVLLVISTLVVFLVKEHQVTTEAAEGKRKVQHELARMRVDRGIRLTENGDLAGSLLWFTNALELDRISNNLSKEGENLHLMRLWAGMRQMPQLDQLYVHKSINCTAISPDGKWVATASRDGTVSIWSTATGKEDRLPNSAETWVNSVAFSPDNKLLAMGVGKPSEWGQVQIWRVGEKEKLQKLEFAGAVLHVAFSPDGRHILGAGEAAMGRGEVRIWEVAGIEILRLPHDKGVVNHAAFSRGYGRLVVTAGGQSGSAKGEVQLWDLAASRRLWSQSFNGAVNHAEFHPDNNTVVTAQEGHGGGSGFAQLWKWDGAADLSGATVGPPMMHDKGVLWACFSPDGRKVLTASYDGTVKTWDSPGGREILSLKIGTTVYMANFSPDGRFLVTASRDRSARVWDAATGEPITPPLYDTGTMSSAQFSPDGFQILTSSLDSARLWKLSTGNQPPAILKTKSWVHQAICSADGQILLTLSDSSRERPDGVFDEVQIWDFKKGAPDSEPLEHDLPFTCAALSSDGRWVATAAAGRNGDPGEVSIWDVQAKKKAIRLKGSETAAFVALSHDGKHVLTADVEKGGKPGNLWLWDALTGDKRHALGECETINVAAFSPDNLWVAVGTGKLTQDTGEAIVWDVVTGKKLQASPLQHKVGEGGTLHLSFSHNSRFLVSASADDSAIVWDIAQRQGDRVGMAFGHTADVTYAAFSADDRLLLTVSKDQAVKVWDLTVDASAKKRDEDPRLLATFKHGSYPNHAAFSADGRLIATGCHDGTTRIWDVKSKELVTILRHQGEVQHVTFSPDESKLLTIDFHRSTLGPSAPPSLAAASFVRRVHARIWNFAPMRQSAKELDAMGQLLGARQFDEAFLDLTAVGFDKLQVLAKDWQETKSTVASESDASRTHAKEAANCEAAGQWFAATWHLSKMISREKNAVEHFMRRARARAHLLQWGLAFDDFSQALELNKKSNVLPEAELRRLHDARGKAYSSLAPPEKSLRDSLDELAQNPENRKTRLKLATALASQRRWNEAIGHLTELIRTDDGSSSQETNEFRENRAKAFGALGEWGKVIEDYNAIDSKNAALWALQAQAQAALAQARLGQAAQQLGHEAIKSYESALKLQNDEKYLLERGRVFARLNKKQEAVRDFTDAALGFAKKKSWLSAITAWTEALQEQPDDVGFLQERALAYHRQSQFAKAVADYSAAIGINPNDPQLWQKRAEVYGSMSPRQWEKAFADYAKAIELQPSSSELYGSRAKAYGQLGNWNEAVNDYAEALRLDPNNAIYRTNLANTLESLGRTFAHSNNWDKAVDVYNKALAIEPKMRRLWEGRALANEKRGAWALAAADYTRAIELPNPDAWLWYQRAYAYVASKEFDKAAEDLLRLPNDYRSWQRLALVRLAEGNHAEYRKACDGMLKRFGEPSSPQMDNSKAWTCVLGPNALSDLNEPVRLSKRAVENSKSNNYLNTLGAAYFRAGDFKNAIASLEEGMKTPTTPSSSATYVNLADWLFLAMAHHGSGNPKEAQYWLAKARPAVDAMNKSSDTTVAAPLTTWQKLEIELLHREAEALLGESKN